MQRGITIVMRDGRVAYLGPEDGAPDPGHAEVVDASGATVVPGLVGLPEAGRVRERGPAGVLLVHGGPLSYPAALWRVWRAYHHGERVS